MSSKVDVSQFTIERLIEIQMFCTEYNTGDNAILLTKVEKEIKRRNGRKFGVQHEL